ncbi:MAG: VWA domain-containing protein [Alphaproteobacteria bacterium]|nr:VWA domain-containing protein [Alphaproteobacteria bacterium]
MKLFNNKLKLAVICSTIALSTIAQVQAKTLHIAIDVSASNPMISSVPFAKIISKRVSKQILALPLGDYVSLRTFGHLKLDNLQQFDVKLTRKAKPEKVAKAVSKFMNSIPKGGVEPQQSTEIIAQLEWGEYDCSAGDTILLITDGIEASSLVNPNKLLEGKAKLPLPDVEYLKGCNVQMIGIGKSTNGSWPSVNVKNLLREWKSYMKASGANFKAIPNP